MNFVTVSDFDKIPYNLPNGDTQNTDFEDFMGVMEQEVLRKHLGHLLYDDLIANGLVAPAQRLASLINGAYYEYSDITYKWVGLNKMLIPYLYVVRTNATLDSHTGTGINVPSVENADKISFRQRASRAWNVFADAYGVCKSHRNSLYGFIQANLIDYSEFVYRDPKHMNPYGL